MVTRFIRALAVVRHGADRPAAPFLAHFMAGRHLLAREISCRIGNAWVQGLLQKVCLSCSGRGRRPGQKGRQAQDRLPDSGDQRRGSGPARWSGVPERGSVGQRESERSGSFSVFVWSPMSSRTKNTPEVRALLLTSVPSHGISCLPGTSRPSERFLTVGLFRTCIANASGPRRPSWSCGVRRP